MLKCIQFVLIDQWTHSKFPHNLLYIHVRTRNMVFDTLFPLLLVCVLFVALVLNSYSANLSLSLHTHAHTHTHTHTQVSKSLEELVCYSSSVPERLLHLQLCCIRCVEGLLVLVCSTSTYLCVEGYL